MHIRDVMKIVHATAVQKGWHPTKCPGPYPCNKTACIAFAVDVPEKLMLVVSELSEALEEYRGGYAGQQMVRIVDGKPEGFAVEMADAVIRIFDMCEALGIDLEAVIWQKHQYNETRPYRHGGKRA